MTQPVKCMACLSPQVRDIDLWLEKGRTYAAIARKFPIPYKSGARHHQSGHAKTAEQWALSDVVAASTTPPVAEAPEVGAVEAMRDQLKRLRAEDTTKMGSGEKSRHEDLQRRVAADLARSEGPAAAGASRGQEEIARLRAIIQATARVLRRHPAAEAAVAAALKLIK